MSTSKRKFLIDTDAGIDDAQAILMAMAYPDDVDIVGITTSHGNVGCEQVGLNVLRLLKVANRMDIPVYKGVNKPLVGKNVHATNYHGLDGFGDVPDPEAPGTEHLQSEHAVQAIIRLVKEHKGNLELICLAPLTNLAVALRLEPDLGKHLKHCYIMGGNYEGKGNITASAEFNFYCDPESANVVLNELGCDITMACWELCLKYTFDWTWYYTAFICAPTTKAKFIKHIEGQTIDKYYKNGQKQVYETADQLITAIALCPELSLDYSKAFAVVETSGTHSLGQMIVDWNGTTGPKENVKIVTSINFDMYKNMMIESVNK